jgi:hypothetical protein
VPNRAGSKKSFFMRRSSQRKAGKQEDYTDKRMGFKWF